MSSPPSDPRSASSDLWPALDYDSWSDALDTLHRWTQIVGKVRLELSPWINHSWHATFYVTARGLTTSPIYHGDRLLEITFDFHRHELRIETGEGELRSMALEPRSVASFYEELMSCLEELDLAVEIHRRPNELPDARPFPEDTVHAAYDPQAARRFWQILAQSHRVFTEFRAGFLGKASPVHFFWGSFDLATTRFSGREAPPHPGGVPNLPDPVAREAYSHEVSSAGFWPGNPMLPQAAYYSYAYPTPDGFAAAEIEPDSAAWNDDLGEFVLPYDAVRNSPSPEETLLAFLESTYAAAAELGDWDRQRLERERKPPI